MRSGTRVRARGIIGLALAGTLVLGGCGVVSPAECQPAPSGITEEIDCREAVALAEAQLPSDHPEIVQRQFFYGDTGDVQHPTDWRGTSGYVVFTYADGTRQMVPITLFNGQMTPGAPRRY